MDLVVEGGNWGFLPNGGSKSESTPWTLNLGLNLTPMLASPMIPLGLKSLPSQHGNNEQKPDGVLFSCFFCNKVLQTWWLNTTQTYYFTVLEI